MLSRHALTITLFTVHSVSLQLFKSFIHNKNVLHVTKKVKNKNQETDGYGRDKRLETEKLKRKEITIAGN